MTLRLVFMGTPDFAVPTLRALLDAGHEVAAVYTQPPRAAGRGMNARKSPVQVTAEAAGLTVLHPESLRSGAEAERFAFFGADAAIVVAYGLLLPKPILAAPKHGCFNLHASLLPRWRGAAPIQRAIMAGDSETGIAVMRMNEGLDTGDICMERRVALSAETTAGALHDQLATLGAALMVDALQALEAGRLDCKPQADAGATYADKITASDTRIDWSRAAVAVHAQIRALSPHPGAWFETTINGKRERIKVLGASLADVSGTPGTLLDDRLTVACGDGALRLTRVQRAGKKPASAEEFLRGAKLGVGQDLG
jgi:methionyl-tRNA formyltransferase